MKRVLASAAVFTALVTAGCGSPFAAGPGPEARGAGPAMGGGYGMGPGMMGGYGMGPGMMGGYGMGPGMMGGLGTGLQSIAPSLTAEQRTRLAAVQQEFAQRQWPLMQQMHQLMWAEGGAANEQQERANYDAMANLQRQMFENRLQARRQMEEVLTPDQREQLRRAGGAGRPGASG